MREYIATWFEMNINGEFWLCVILLVIAIACLWLGSKVEFIVYTDKEPK